MDISLIICTRNRAGELRQTLEALRAVVFPAGQPTELLVVDNGSTDDTRGVVESFRPGTLEVRYVFEGQRGQANARNRALVETNGHIIVFTDDDVRPEPQWIEKITRPIADGLVDCTVGMIQLAPQVSRPWMTNRHRGYLADTTDRDFSNPGEMVGANMAFARKVLEKVPAFDAELGPGGLGFSDDTLFSHQLLAAGFRLRGVADARVEHHPDPSRLTRQSFLARARGQGVCRAYVDFHWEHKELSLPLLRSLKWSACLMLERFEQRRSWPFSDGIPDWEIMSVEHLAYVNAFRKLSGTRRRYEHHGLVKLP